ncbi:MAG: hypothetical protein RI907_3606 [Pseudomonadota bacterium]|jgi:hypothetical protein
MRPAHLLATTTLAVMLTFSPAHAATAPAVTPGTLFTVSDVRPEAFSWLWDNADAALLQAANPDIVSFRWLAAPATPEHLGYSTGARHETVAKLQGAAHTVVAEHLSPEAARGRVPADNFLGAKPYSFVALRVSIDGGWPFVVLVHYLPTGSGFESTQLRIELVDATAADPLANAYVAHLGRTLQGLQPTLTAALNERFFKGVLQTRGKFAVGTQDKQLNVPLTIDQEIKGITPAMLDWWWDHIGNTERYRLWQPIDHVSFQWRKAPTQPDLHFDVGAKQRVKEYVGKIAFTLDITGADPAAIAPPEPIVYPGFFYARTNLSVFSGILPDNSLVHQWKANATGDGVVLRTMFLNTALARIFSKTFFEDLGSHALREFQMLPYFLPRLYKREELGQ